jgi:hypothetical protein
LDDLLDLIGGERAPLATVVMIVRDGGRCQGRRGREHTTSGGSPAEGQGTTTADGHAEIEIGHGLLLSTAVDEHARAAGAAIATPPA